MIAETKELARLLDVRDLNIIVYSLDNGLLLILATPS